MRICAVKVEDRLRGRTTPTRVREFYLCPGESFPETTSLESNKYIDGFLEEVGDIEYEFSNTIGVVHATLSEHVHPLTVIGPYCIRRMKCPRRGR